MRIVSPFHDYYDGVQRHGQDRRLVYVRNEQQGECPVALPRLRNILFRSRPVDVVDQITIGFCGKLYPVVTLSRYSRDGEVSLKKICYKQEEIDAFVAEHASGHEEAYHAPTHYQKHWMRSGLNLRRFELVELVGQTKRAEATEEVQNLFRTALAPIFLYRFRSNADTQRLIRYNPRLSPWEFYRCHDAHSAFQEIATFLGGLASPERPIPPVSDETMAAAKGFDKHSFRKDPRVRS